MPKGKSKTPKETAKKRSLALRKGGFFSCLICGTEFWRKPKDIKKGNNKFCSKKCYFVWQKGRPRSEEFREKCRGRFGSLSPTWKGGISIKAGGYIHIKCAGHPRSKKNGYIPLHVLIMEQKIGRFLKWEGLRGTPDSECVHHINGNVADNRLENLKLMTLSEHSTLHHSGKEKHPTINGCKICSKCLKNLPVTSFCKTTKAWCLNCKNEYERNRYAGKKTS